MKDEEDGGDCGTNFHRFQFFKVRVRHAFAKLPPFILYAESSLRKATAMVFAVGRCVPQRFGW